MKAETTEERPSRALPFAQWAPRFAPHLAAFALPVNALVFVLTGPHRGLSGLIYVGPIVACGLLDARGGIEARQPANGMPSWPFDLMLLVLATMQVANVWLLGRMMAAGHVVSVDTVAAMVVVGSSSGYTGIVVAHELIHRPRGPWRWIGRLLLATVVYEHFYTEHIRGHHLRVGTDQDPATARFGEAFGTFYLRTVPAQFRSAWHLETMRLAAAGAKVRGPRILHNRVAQGVVVESAFIAGICTCFGWAALPTQLLQAWWAIGALEVVNYFEHWGLQRSGRRVRPEDSWDTHSRFTHYALTGLSRHADHHAFASRPYQDLRVWHESPKLPAGYLVMFTLVLFRNERFRKFMTVELSRRRLGPFARNPTQPGEMQHG